MRLNGESQLNDPLPAIRGTVFTAKPTNAGESLVTPIEGNRTNETPPRYGAKHIIAKRKLALLLIAVCAFASTATAADKPNFLLIMADDQGYGETGYYGHPIARTPNLDKMAAVGLRLDRYYAAHPFCSPTRASVMTGRHPNRSGCFHFRYTTRPEEITVAEALQSAGYTTGHFGKWHIGPIGRTSAFSPMNNGFDVSLSVENLFEVDPALQRNGAAKDSAEQFKGDGSVVAARAALEFIATAKQQEKPFLAVVWFSSIHGGHKATNEHRKPFDNSNRRRGHWHFIPQGFGWFHPTMALGRRMRGLCNLLLLPLAHTSCGFDRRGLRGLVRGWPYAHCLNRLALFWADSGHPCPGWPHIDWHRHCRGLCVFKVSRILERPTHRSNRRSPQAGFTAELTR